MDGMILTNGRASDVDAYVRTKFQQWRGWRYSKKERTAKAVRYYEYAKTPEIKQTIKEAYLDTFGEDLPVVAQPAKGWKPVKLDENQKSSYDELLDKKKELLLDAINARDKLDMMKKRGAVQEGDGFMLELRALVEPVLGRKTFDKTNFKVENEARGVMALTGSSDIRKNSIEAQFEFMAGLKAKSEIEFEFDSNLAGLATKLVASLNSEFKSGVWGSGSVAAHLKKTGIDASAAIALGFGMDCRVAGDVMWSVEDVSVTLSGNAKLFAGAKASASAGLKIDPKSLELSVAAKAFAGVKASCSGTVAFGYQGKELVSATGKANVSFGAGASFEAGITSSLFGPTTINFGADLALGLGTGASTSTSIHFTRIGLAASSQFNKLATLPTIMKGYTTDLQDQERENRHYFEKASGLLNDFITEQKEMLETVSRLPKDRAELLLARS